MGDQVRKLTPPVIRKDDDYNNNHEHVVDVPKHEEGVPLMKRNKMFSFADSNKRQRETMPDNIHMKKRTFPTVNFNVELSTEQNYGYFGSGNKLQFYGEFIDLRQRLDYSFHSNYAKERQLFQDDIIIRTLEDPIITDLHGNTCARPEYPWLVFTAGAMGAGEFHICSL